jgi:protein-tyrosine phosphatase
MGFVDVHTHVVPSGDDGVESIEEGLDLCRGAVARGTTLLVATPHAGPMYPMTREREERVREAHAVMQPRAAGFGLDLRLGFELTPEPGFLSEDISRYEIEGLGAVLMELPFRGALDLSLRLAEAIEDAGLTPIVGHPERSHAVQDRPERLRAFAERGWLIQVNATSLTGDHGPGAEAVGWSLVKGGFASLMGSDGHRASRPPFLDDAYAETAARIGEESALRLFEGAALVMGRGADLAERR